MNKFYITPMSVREIKRGLVIRFEGGVWVVSLDDGTYVSIDKQSACQFSVDENDRLVCFVSGHVDGPYINGSNLNRRRVVVRRDPDNLKCAFVWGYEHSYRQAQNALAKIELAIKKEQDRKNATRQCVDSIGECRIRQSHHFREQAEPCGFKTIYGPRKFSALIMDIVTRRQLFFRSLPRGVNDTMSQWIERNVGDNWVKVEISDEEICSLAEALEIGGDAVEIINRITLGDVPAKVSVPVELKAPQSRDRRQVSKVLEPTTSFGSLEEMAGATQVTAVG